MFSSRHRQSLIRFSALLCVAALIATRPACNDAEQSRVDVRLRRGLTEQIVSGQDWCDYSGNPVIQPGPPGAWDSWAVMSMTVVKVADTLHLYYEGGRTGCDDLQIGHATSIDALNWKKDPANPVLRPGRAGQWDDQAVWDPFMIYQDGIFKMWYGGQPESRRDYECGYAESRDGRHFVKRGRISDFEQGEMADMHVVHDQMSNRYVMFYWDRRFDLGKSLRLAVSPNETDFDFQNSSMLRIAGEKSGHRYTHVVRSKQVWYMFYGFDGGPGRSGCAVSRDLIHWSIVDTSMRETEDAEILLLNDDLHLMFYCPAGMQDEEGCDIRLALKGGIL